MNVRSISCRCKWDIHIVIKLKMKESNSTIDSE